MRTAPRTSRFVALWLVMLQAWSSPASAWALRPRSSPETQTAAGLEETLSGRSTPRAVRPPAGALAALSTPDLCRRIVDPAAARTRPIAEWQQLHTEFWTRMKTADPLPMREQARQILVKDLDQQHRDRSEERRVGKECRSRW